MIPSEPSLYTTFLQIQQDLEKHDICLSFQENTQFLISHQAFLKQFPKPPVMETFYRWMRKKFDILMDGDKPKGGKRNYDEENRKFDKKHIHAGQKIQYPTSRADALLALENFVEYHLDTFGTLEDAMYKDDDAVHHSLLSTSINFGLLTPLEVIQAVA
jgi:deoxyribodipyrimidine photolyase-related protein